MSETRDRKGKRPGRRSRGLQLSERDGFWHVQGTVRTGGRSIRVRRSLGLPADAQHEEEAQALIDGIKADIIAEATGQKRRGDAVAIAAKAYLMAPRERPLAPSAIRIVQELTLKFGPRRLNDIPPGDWVSWVDARQKGNKAATRERFLNGVVAFLRFCREHHGLADLPRFVRDKKARNPNKRARRPVQDLRPDLIWRLFMACHITVRAQLAAEWSTGGRVSSILYGCRLADLILAPGREQITYRNTKNGRDVPAALNATAATIMREYLDWRGNLHDREAPLFLTYRKKPYADNGKAWGGQNKTAFNAARRRARRDLLKEAFATARDLRRSGQRDDSLQVLLAARNDVRLLRRVTQHWFRHMMATRMAHRDMRSAMDQGGWDDHRSLMGYVHDVPERRRSLVSEFDDLGTFLTRESQGEAPNPYTARKAQQ